MHPAPSMILFTVLSGFGFGLMTFLGLGVPDVSGFTGFAFFFIAFGFAGAGLLASVFHLGNPRNALKAFTQWRSSWLSREACLAALTMLVMGLYAIGVVFFHQRWVVLGYLGAALAVATIFCTSMIYAQLKTVPRWNHWTTPALFLAYGLAGGAYLATRVEPAIYIMLLVALAQIATWLFGDSRFRAAGSTLASATGLGSSGSVRMFEAPHSSQNYLLREMVHVIGRKHSLKLRAIAILLFVILPYLLLEFIGFSHGLVALAFLLHLAGLLVVRWLFFAEAEHVVGLYYDQR